jgi:predicted acyltransferase
MRHFMLPLADVNGAFNGLAGMLAGYLAAVLAFILVIAGYQYMFALDDHNKAMQSKRAIGVALVGAIVVALAVGWAPTFISKIGH